jgi:hypothetical protein
MALGNGPKSLVEEGKLLLHATTIENGFESIIFTTVALFIGIMK